MFFLGGGRCYDQLMVSPYKRQIDMYTELIKGDGKAMRVIQLKRSKVKEYMENRNRIENKTRKIRKIDRWKASKGVQ